MSIAKSNGVSPSRPSASSHWIPWSIARHTALDERRHAVLAEDFLQEVLALEDAPPPPDLDLADPEVALGGLVGEPGDVRAVAERLPDEVLVDVGQVLERGPLARRHGMPRTEHEPHALAPTHPLDLLEVTVAAAHGRPHPADAVRVPSVRAQAGRAREVEVRPRGDDQVVVVHPHRVPAAGRVGDQVVLVGVDLGHPAVEEADAVAAVDGPERERQVLGSMCPTPSQMRDGR